MDDSDQIFEPLHTEMGRHVKSGMLNSGMAQVIKILCQFVSVVVMSRLLSPSDFGLVAMASPISGFVTLFLDLGLGQATIQKASVTHDEVNAFFWINIAIGAALALLLVMLSPLAGWYYGDPRVTGLTAAMALLIVIGSFGIQHGAILRRRLSFRAIFIIDVTNALASLIVAIVAALTIKTYWAVYYGLLAGNIVPVVGVWIAAKWNPTFPRIPRDIGGSMKFGLGVTTYNITNYLARNLDNVLIGKFWGSLILGLYDRAYKLLLFPLQRIVGPINDVMMPILSHLKNDAEQYRQMYLKVMSQLVLITWPGILCAIVFGHTLIDVMLGDKWAGTAEIFLPLAIVALVQMINSISGTLFVTQGRSGDFARWGLLSGFTSVAAFVIGLPFGAVGVATAYAISEYLRTPFLWWYATRKGPVRKSDIIYTMIPCIGAGIATLLALMGLSYAHILSGLPLLIVAGAASYLIFAGAMTLFPGGRVTIRQSLKIIMQNKPAFL